MGSKWKRNDSGSEMKNDTRSKALGSQWKRKDFKS